MKITGIIWLEEIVNKLAWKHGVQQQEVRDVFANSPVFHLVEKGHRTGENLYVAFGETNEGRRLAVFFVWKKDGKALIVSARDITKAERRRYEHK